MLTVSQKGATASEQEVLLILGRVAKSHWASREGGGMEMEPTAHAWVMTGVCGRHVVGISLLRREQSVSTGLGYTSRGTANQGRESKEEVGDSSSMASNHGRKSVAAPGRRTYCTFLAGERVQDETMRQTGGQLIL